MKDSLIIMELSKRMGYEMSYPHTVEIFREMGQAWPALAGMSYARLEDGGLQWPCPTPEHPGTQFLFKGGFPRGKGKFTLVKYKPSAEETDTEYPVHPDHGPAAFPVSYGQHDQAGEADRHVSARNPTSRSIPRTRGRFRSRAGRR